jgi:ATP-dependent RNA helicase SUPV3L1/SUV3
VVPARGEVAIEVDSGLPDGFYHAIGYRPLGARALRVDMVERLAAEARSLTRKAPAEAPATLVSMSGTSREGFAEVMGALGFQAELAEDKVVLAKERRGGRRPERAKRRPAHDPFSPFAKLAELGMAR